MSVLIRLPGGRVVRLRRAPSPIVAQPERERLQGPEMFLAATAVKDVGAAPNVYVVASPTFFMSAGTADEDDSHKFRKESGEGTGDDLA
jgi:hypothetical protein